MKVLLISISSDVRPIGLINISSYIRAHDIEHSLIYCILPIGVQDVPEKMLAGLGDFLRGQKFDLIGISVTTVYFNVASQISRLIRKTLPDAFLMWGGIHATVDPDESLGQCDAVCVGEGEEPFLEFLQHFGTQEQYNVRNIYLNTPSGIKRNELRDLVQDLGTRPFPQIDWQNTYILLDERVLPLTRELVESHSPKQGTMYDIMPSRGCPYSCTYCCNSIFRRMYRGKGRILRFRPVDQIIEEMKYALHTFPKIKIFDFQDDAFGSAPEPYLEEFVEKYIANINKPFHIRIIPNMVNEKKIALLKRAGLVSAVMGLQASDRINRTIYKRPTTSEMFLSTARLLRKYEIAGRYDVIIDNPYENEDDLVEVIRTFEAVPKPYKLNIFSLSFLPFTELTLKAIADGNYLPESTGYIDSMNKRVSHIYPDLTKILEMTPYTPRVIIDWFLAIKNERTRRGILRLYYNTVFRLERIAIRLIMKNSNTILIAKRLVYFALKVTQRPRALSDHPAGD